MHRRREEWLHLKRSAVLKACASTSRDVMKTGDVMKTERTVAVHVVSVLWSIHRANGSRTRICCCTVSLDHSLVVSNV